jgi:rubredoxin
MEDFNKNLLRVCPACGFSFRAFDVESRTPKIKCPMCGYEFPEANLQRHLPKKGDKNLY